MSKFQSKIKYCFLALNSRKIPFLFPRHVLSCNCYNSGYLKNLSFENIDFKAQDCLKYQLFAVSSRIIVKFELIGSSARSLRVGGNRLLLIALEVREIPSSKVNGTMSVIVKEYMTSNTSCVNLSH